jgi:hypothetical protein
VTGGGDGGIMSWNIGQHLSAEECHSDIEARRIACTRDGRMLVLSEEGKLFCHSSSGFVPILNDLGQIIQVFKDRVFILTIDGSLTILNGTIPTYFISNNLNNYII